MGFSFATCDRKSALGFLQKSYPGREVDDSGSTATLLDLVEKDVIRVQDPMMHPNTQIIPARNWDEDRRDQVVAVCQAFHDSVTQAVKDEQ